MTSSETPNGSGSAIFEAAKKLMEAVTGKDEHAPADPKAMAKIIAEKKAAARKITEGLEKTPEKTEQELKNIPAESTNLKEAKARLEVAKATPQAKNVAWLVDSVGDLQHNANAIAFVARIAEAPVELQEDPHYLLAEGAKLFWSTPWAELMRCYGVSTSEWKCFARKIQILLFQKTRFAMHLIPLIGKV